MNALATPLSPWRLGSPVAANGLPAAMTAPGRAQHWAVGTSDARVRAAIQTITELLEIVEQSSDYGFDPDRVRRAIRAALEALDGPADRSDSPDDATVRNVDDLRRIVELNRLRISE